MNKYLSLLFVALIAALPAAADHNPAHATTTSLKSDFDRVSKKLVDLAEATPAEKFGWKPVDGVRTISEVYMHVVGANFFIAKALGVAPPADFGPDLEKKVTAKADVIAKLKESQDAVRKAFDQNSDLAKMVELFGAQRSVLDSLLIFNTHSHEHLGQSIAYARTAGVVPPWSRSEG